jgi:hypothetical protein
LRLLWGVDAEQADTLTTKLHGIAIRDHEAMGRSSSVKFGLGECGHSRSPKYDQR